MATVELRDEVVRRMRDEERILILGCGTSSLRVRPALIITEDELRRGLVALDRVLTSLA